MLTSPHHPPRNFFSAVPGPVNTKKRKLASDQANETQIEETTPTSSLLILTAQEPSLQLSSYWESGDSRKLFAPKLYYGTDCDVRKAVMDRIEKLEMVNSIAADWRTLVDGGDQEDLCSEHDIFMIRHRSMYLACALRKFVDEASKTSRWTWQQCIEYSIGLMNDVGLATPIGDHWQGGTDDWPTARKAPLSNHLYPKIACHRSLSRIQTQWMLSGNME
ncbi:hypothetical protein MHU86_14674 [Fragilaria crotonensis]|nr:hypothetical protein MHU86_14674 [Fragilaria crotonensis]